MFIGIIIAAQPRPASVLKKGQQRAYNATERLRRMKTEREKKLWIRDFHAQRQLEASWQGAREQAWENKDSWYGLLS